MKNIYYISAGYILKEQIIFIRSAVLPYLNEWRKQMEHFHLFQNTRWSSSSCSSNYFLPRPCNSNVIFQLNAYIFLRTGVSSSKSPLIRKNRSSNKMILQYIKSKAAEIPGARPMVPKKKHSDFEKEIMNALQQVITGIVIGCYYNYCQVIMSKKIILL